MAKKKRLRFITLLTACLGLMLFAAACGGDKPRHRFSSGSGGGADSGGGGGQGRQRGGGAQQEEDLRDTPVAEVSCSIPLTTPVYPNTQNLTPPSRLGTFQQQQWNKIVKVAQAHALSQPKYLYRWGSASWEGLRVNWSPIFTITQSFNNANGNGGIMAGLGLYAAETPVEYGVYTGEVYLITVPSGMPTLDLSDTNVQNDIYPANSYGPAVSDSDIYTMGSAGSNAASGSLTGLPGGDPVPVAVKFHWGTGTWYWVLKNPDGVKFENFSGTEMSSKEIFKYLKSNDSYFGPKVKTTLSKRIFNPGAVEMIPTPPMQVYPVSKWDSHPEVSHCAVTGAPTTGGTAYWRMDGTCGTYTSSGMTLVEDNVNPKRCEKKFPTERCRYYSGWKIACKRVLKADSSIVIESDVAGCDWYVPYCS